MWWPVHSLLLSTLSLAPQLLPSSYISQNDSGRAPGTRGSVLHSVAHCTCRWLQREQPQRRVSTFPHEDKVRRRKKKNKKEEEETESEEWINAVQRATASSDDIKKDIKALVVLARQRRLIHKDAVDKCVTLVFKHVRWVSTQLCLSDSGQVLWGAESIHTGILSLFGLRAVYGLLSQMQ